MSKPCIICKEDYFIGSYDEPAERCWCGQMASGTLWYWGGITAYVLYIRYAFARFCFWLGTQIVIERNEK